MNRPSRYANAIWVVCTLALGALLTTLMVLRQERSNAAFVDERFAVESRELADAIHARFALYEYGLRGARGLIQKAGEHGITAADFRYYMASRDMEREFPGARGFGFVHRVPADELREHARHHAVPPPTHGAAHAPHAGDHFIIELVEPLERNREAVGLDIASEPRRRLAAQTAMRSGRATLSAPITLVQATEAEDRAFLLLLPIYRPGLPLDSPERREAAAFGWAYAPLLVDDVLAGLPLHTAHIALSLTDITDVEHATVFFNTVAQGASPAAGAGSVSLLRVPYGRSWMVRTEMRPSYAAQFGLLSPALVAWVGALVTLLVAALQWVLLVLRQQHEQHLLDINASLEARVVERTRSLEDVQRFLRTVLDAMPSMISYWDRDQVNREANRANLEWRRPHGGDIRGQRAHEVVGDAVYATLQPHIAAVLRGEPQSFELSMASPLTGELREMHMRYLPDLRDGGVQGWYAVIDDVTERNRNRRALEAALAQQATERMRLQSILQGTHVGTWEWNVQTGECRYNERWAQMLGHDYDELRPSDQQAWLDHVHPDDVPRAQRALRRHFAGEHAFYASEVRMRHAEGHWIWVLNRGQVRSWTPGGEPEWMYGTQLDISASKAIEQDLREAKRAAEAASASKSAFLANMSHEIRTPLNAVLGVTHLLADSPLDGDQRALLAKAQTAGRALLGIVNDVLDLAKIEAGEMRLEREPFSLCELLREVESVYGVQAQHKGLALTLERGPALPEALIGDAGRLRQVLVNLVGNAIKFTARGGVVIAAARDEAGGAPRLRLSVRDSGIGITPEQQARLFQPFTQADETTTRRFGGTGLGLSIVRRLVGLMQGEVGLSSTPGQGSEFWVSVPLHEAALSALRPAPAAAPANGLNGLRVLLVDDSEVNLDIARRMLEREGARVHTCGDGAQALAWLQAQAGAVDAVLMDVQMPVMDGLEATRHIRADTTFTGLPVIALTAGALADERQRALDAGFSDFVAKPLEPALLLAALRRACPGAGAAVAVTPAPLAVPAAAPPAGWPRVEGVDALSAHRTLGGDEQLFQRVLTRLLAEQHEWAALPADGPLAWDAAQQDHWRVRAHRLRGSAGMIGALDLARAATGLEAALDAHALADAAATLAELQRRFAQLKQGAAVYTDRAPGTADEPTDDAAAAAPLDEAQWQARLQALLSQLESNDLDAGTSFAHLRAAIAQRLGAAVAQAVSVAIDDLCFDAAAEQLQAAALTAEDGPAA